MHSIFNVLPILMMSLAVESVDYSTITNCSLLPKAALDFQTMIQFSPFTVFVSGNHNDFYCSQNVFTGPAVNDNSYTYSVINMNTATSPVAFTNTDIILSPDNTTATVVYCKNGTRQIVNVLENNMINDNSYQCIYECSPSNTSALLAFMCMGRTSSDHLAISTIASSLNSLIRSSGFTLLSAPETGCASGQYCPLFSQ